MMAVSLEKSREKLSPSEIYAREMLLDPVHISDLTLMMAPRGPNLVTVSHNSEHNFSYSRKIRVATRFTEEEEILKHFTAALSEKGLKIDGKAISFKGLNETESSSSPYPYVELSVDADKETFRICAEVIRKVAEWAKGAYPDYASTVELSKDSRIWVAIPKNYKPERTSNNVTVKLAEGPAPAVEIREGKTMLPEQLLKELARNDRRKPPQDGR